MANLDLVNYIQGSLSNGISLAQIKQNLLSKGWPDLDIDQAIRTVNNTQHPQGSTGKKRLSKKVWISLGTSIGIILVIAVFFLLFPKFVSNTISDTDMSQGTLISLKEDKQVKFNIGEEKHQIMVDSVYESSIDMIIQSNQINVTLNVGETRNFDLNHDQVYDIQIKLKNIEDGMPNIFIKKIS